ncbi:MAG: uncharacterized protein A8A55_3009, partial [Amphiamblys sp. WSBS2006]
MELFLSGLLETETDAEKRETALKLALKYTSEELETKANTLSKQGSSTRVELAAVLLAFQAKYKYEGAEPYKRQVGLKPSASGKNRGIIYNLLKKKNMDYPSVLRPGGNNATREMTEDVCSAMQSSIRNVLRRNLSPREGTFQTELSSALKMILSNQNDVFQSISVGPYEADLVLTPRGTAEASFVEVKNIGASTRVRKDLLEDALLQA